MSASIDIKIRFFKNARFLLKNTRKMKKYEKNSKKSKKNAEKRLRFAKNNEKNIKLCDEPSPRVKLISTLVIFVIFSVSNLLIC